MIQAVTPSGTPPTPSAAPASATPETPAVGDEPAGTPATTTSATALVDGKTVVNTDLDANEVKQWATLSRANREAKAKITALEKERDELAALKPTAEKSSALAAHIKEGKHLAAAAAAGIDIEAAFAEWMADEQANVSGPPPKELVELKEKLERLEAKDAESEKTRKEQDEARDQADSQRAQENVQKMIATVLEEDGKGEAPKWRRCAKEPEAATEARTIVLDAVKKLARPVTDDEANALFRGAFDQLEEHYKVLGSRYSLEDGPPRDRTSRGTSRVRESVASRQSVTIDNNRGSLRKPPQTETGFKTFREVKAEILEKRRASNN